MIEHARPSGDDVTTSPACQQQNRACGLSPLVMSVAAATVGACPPAQGRRHDEGSNPMVRALTAGVARLAVAVATGLAVLAVASWFLETSMQQAFSRIAGS